MGTIGLCLASTAQAAIRIRVSWTRVYDEISPVRNIFRQPNSVLFWLDNGRVVTSENNARAQTSFDQEAVMTNKAGTDYYTHYKISGGRITRVDTYPGRFVRTEVIATDQRSSCSASVNYRKIPGQAYFYGKDSVTGQQMVETYNVAENVSCQISN